MKKICIILFTLFIIVLTVAGQARPIEKNSDYLRIHIRANSNGGEDQAVKYLVRDEVVKAITPWVAQCSDKQTALRVMSARLQEIEEISEGVLLRYGYTYGASAHIRAEEFPTRVYEEHTLEAGVYDALILELGEGAGDNWWCCIYPPFCFTQSQEVIYRSKILDILCDRQAQK